MFDLQQFLNKLDEMYNNPARLEDYLAGGVKDAEKSQDKGAMLVILNELMGLYRVTSKYDKCTACADKILELCKDLGLEGTVNFATALLNIATAYRVMKRYNEAEEYYSQVKKIFDEKLPLPDYRMATLHNNLSLLYSETNRLDMAKDELLMAMDLIKSLENSEIEIAITHTNLGNICFALHQNEQAEEHMLKAVEIFENQKGEKDAHYPSALSGLGELYFSKGELEKSAGCYEKALDEIKAHYGINDYYNVTLENLNLVKDTLKRQRAVALSKLKGLDISQKYYETYGKKMLEEKYGNYLDRITVGLVGEGSECLGFDDEYSSDHDFGPSFCIWLDDDLYDEIGDELKSDYDNLPKEFMGFSARNTTVNGKNRVGVLNTNQFYKSILEKDFIPYSDNEWHSVEEKFLCTATNGRIFKSSSNSFEKIREHLSYYPHNVKIQKLAIALGNMAQTGQVNFSRMLKRKDFASAHLCINEFVKYTINCVYILNNTYTPYYKWQFKGMKNFDNMKDVQNLLESIMDTDIRSSEIKEKIEKVCDLIVAELNRQNLSSIADNFLEFQKEEVLNNG